MNRALVIAAMLLLSFSSHIGAANGQSPQLHSTGSTGIYACSQVSTSIETNKLIIAAGCDRYCLDECHKGCEPIQNHSDYHQCRNQCYDSCNC